MGPDTKKPSIVIAFHGPPGHAYGPAKKYLALAGELAGLGYRVQIVRSRVGGVTGAFDLARQIGAARADVFIMRSGLAFPLSWPALLVHRVRGAFITVEVPTPSTVAIREALSAQVSAANKIASLATTLVSFPWLAQIANRIVQYGHESPYLSLGLKHRTQIAANAVDPASLPSAKPPEDQGPLRLVAVGWVSRWHGFDRLIQGMTSGPVGSRQLTIVGDGPERPRLRAMVRELELTSCVRFTGALHGTDLDSVCGGADAGVGSLADHRKGLGLKSPLKNREYLARGLPVIFSGEDRDLRKAAKFGLAIEVAEDETPVQLAPVLAWLTRLRENDDIRERARQFAEEQLSYRAQIAAFLPVGAGTKQIGAGDVASASPQ